MTGGTEGDKVEIYYMTAATSLSLVRCSTLITGQKIDAGFMAPSAALPFVNAGSMRLLGITFLQPIDLVPDVPVLAGQGVGFP
jgi:tripartite-type tricarboxylate transporter receptor subunit TctC